MIVREQEDSFIMIEQDNHGMVSSGIMKHWKDSLFYGKEFRESVHIAIRYHDVGWKSFDKQPFWNEQNHAPYSFSDYPLSPKTAIYTMGINEVEKIDAYAALLCSKHYSRFLLADYSDTAVAFIEQEKNRRKRISDSIGEIDLELFKFHYELLKFGDNLSLYFCLNDPGVLKENEHIFFQNGIPLPIKPGEKPTQIMTLNWINQNIVSAHPFPFNKSMSVKIQQKVVMKDDILKHGLIKSYEGVPFNEVELQLVSEN